MKPVTEWLAEERRARIAQLLAEQGKVTVQQLIQCFQVSEDTVRRDLKDMAEQGLLRRVHGGAMPVQARAPGGTWRERQGTDEAEKLALVRAMLAELEGGELLFVDSGTTNALLARELPRHLPFTVITTNPQAALALVDHPRCEVVLPGGRLNPRTASVVGPQALELIESVRADVCLLGVCAVSSEAGITCTEYEEQAIKQAMLRRAHRTLALATSAKLGAELPYRVAPVEAVSRLFTTATEDDPARRAVQALGVQVRAVPLG
ncbi:MAG TPA: DeoR/GlpR family DNA-binding transcription regulator [Burkholderiaceae bacterium]|nr:DeoR/GlpR family DNA-binding transcription regulator [Burkholderiaceae bacterium]